MKKNTTETPSNNDFTIVIHGGAGTIKKKYFTPELEAEYRNTLQEALLAGKEKLNHGGLAVEAVEIVIKVMENSPLFNAGKGSVFSNTGIQEMDASIMDGRDLSCGAVAGVTNLKNPIEGARLVKDSTKHVLLYGARAQEFCIDKGATYADSSYFFTKKRWDQWQRALKKDQIKLDHSEIMNKGDKTQYLDSKKFGTVGCVIVDQYGNVAAATSTGGLTNKKYGRIGDSPIIGAGTYADNKTCAVSCTGRGEFFIRGTIARDIAAIMQYKEVPLAEAAELTMAKLNSIKDGDKKGKGGFIAVDNQGNYVMLFNTRGMYRGIITKNTSPTVKIFKDE